MSVTPYITRIVVPEDALRLNEDAQALARIGRELRWIDPYNVASDPQKGRRLLRFVAGQIKMAERHAREKLQNEYLAPVKKGRRNK